MTALKEDKSLDDILKIIRMRSEFSKELNENIESLKLRFEKNELIKQIIASRYLKSINKGEVAQELVCVVSKQIRKKEDGEDIELEVPKYISESDRMGLLISNKLNNSKELIKIEEHFKLIAGPGAGKTTFLINHIKNILANSKRLSKVKKIACITYTNTGVETILSRLEDSLDDVEVSTIHSFLYKNVIKPYLWVLGDEFKFGYENINGHDEIIPTHSLLERWIKETKQNYLFGKDKELIKALSNLRWEMND